MTRGRSKTDYNLIMPFEEISHTADWSLRVWAADLRQLFEESAKGMNAIAGTRLADSPRVRRNLSLSAADKESLLVSFLSELVYFAEQNRLAFDEFDLKIEAGPSQTYNLSAMLTGASIQNQDKAIKAVTYHNLHIRQTRRGFEVEIVFDV
ncbi:MAG: archease [Anaerolineales bacterium]|jgi:SHS2 domain-containing protein